MGYDLGVQSGFVKISVLAFFCKMRVHCPKLKLKLRCSELSSAKDVTKKG